MKRTWILGTRGSKLALRQTEIVKGLLSALYPDLEFATRIIKTTGDTVWDKPLHLIGGKGLFVKEIEEALLANDIDLAVHSMKDMPVELPDGLTVGAVLTREDPHDAFFSLKYARLEDVRSGRIGTGSLRRKAQVLHFNPALEIVPIRGNVDTRLRKLAEQDLDGIILACAGVKRMGLGASIREIIPYDIMVPPSGQGAIGIETRNDDKSLRLVAPLIDKKSLFEVTVERKLQLMIGGGCSVPLGINASFLQSILTLRTALGTEEGELLVRKSVSGPEEAADELIARSFEAVQEAKNKA
jgi:hydroxymethylbilane synthase